VVISCLQVGGDSPAQAAINLEIVLRTLFASPIVQGIYLRGIDAQSLDDPSAALVDADGQPNAAGRSYEGLVRNQWWTDTTLRTDELGNVRTAVFAGWYELSVALGADEDQVVRLRVLVDGDEDQEAIVLQPVKRSDEIDLRPLPGRAEPAGR